MNDLAPVPEKRGQPNRGPAKGQPLGWVGLDTIRAQAEQVLKELRGLLTWLRQQRLADSIVSHHGSLGQGP